MGNEPVLLCSARGGEWYWNNGKSPEKLEDIAAKKVTNEDGKLLCVIETKMVFEIRDKTINFTKEVPVSMNVLKTFSYLPTNQNVSSSNSL